MAARLFGSGSRQSATVAAALREHAERSLAGLAVARTVIFAILTLWVFANYGVEAGVENLAVLALFAGLGVAAYLMVRGRPERLPLLYVFAVLDVLLLAFTLLTPGRTVPDGWPWQTVLRDPSYLYFLILPALTVLTFRPALVMWSGACVAAVWLASAFLIAGRPNAVVGMGDLDEAAGDAVYLARYLEPTYVHPDDTVVKIFVTLLLSGILALAAWRARQLVYDQAEVARERANLARYVAPGLVDRLARSDRPFGATRSQEAVVLFADVKGFTALAERLSPDATMDLLRDFHARMAAVVFRYGGTLDKFIGDGLMATFGTPEAATDDAARGIGCALTMLDELRAWSGERRARGESPVEAGVGLHSGPVTMGDIGDARRLEFAVIGDTVNVAQRLERLTRELGCPLALSGACRARAAAGGAVLPPLTGIGPRHLRGRAEPIEVWVLGGWARA